ncbi:uncharacterized protein TM35_000242240 [Trypanosoma theileri]|uniref:Leucine rich n=1 Tax=Trypanosoma theileri TaxID=67003 RepID=A0A1X0NQV7_9TRYP|nr:uncharacterized protein TM35_000242240 [Trypanosoma theileri]ORC87074.1 hypothetical protein TM35_000242240 [Trypanosoma theileri]
MHSEAAEVYVAACNEAHAECALELVYALDNNERTANLADRAVRLNDVDLACVAEALMVASHPLRVLNVENNAFGLPGLQALLGAIEENPGLIRELRLGRNKLKDQAAVAIGHTLSRDGCGLKVLDLSENEITKLGVIPIATALGSESCDIVELSFHNNKIEADAAMYLGQAIREAGKLRHLHLGYNAIRDAGAAHLAQCIPVTISLSTLDLTANRIGPDGGKELARALMTSTCNIQRLNLRHNLFDSETIEMYADVIRHNTSLIQLFLGFMNPDPGVAALVLSALSSNRTMLLLDIFGWKLHPENTLELISNIQKTNNTVMTIVTDACQSIAGEIDAGNLEREARGQHPIYVGPDDREAAAATTSLRRISRAQSRRHSRASSRGPLSRTGSPQRRVTERSSSRKDSDAHSRHSSRAPPEQVYRFPQNDQTRTASPNSVKEKYNQQNQGSISRESGGDMKVRGKSLPQSDIQGNESMRRIIEQLQNEINDMKQKQRTYESRIMALEKRKECFCGCEPSGFVNRGKSSQVARESPLRRTQDQSTNDSMNRGDMSYTPIKDDYKIPENGMHSNRSTTMQSGFHHRQPQDQTPPRQRSRPASLHGSEHNSLPDRGAVVNARSLSVNSTGTCGAPADLPQVVNNRIERSEPAAEPREIPSERKPPEVMLQTSARPSVDYRPHLGPAPSKDKNPPRRKGSVHI